MNSLENLREEINKIDKDILTKLKERLNLVKEIAEAKKELGQGIEDEGREEQLRLIHKDITEELDLNDDFVIKLFALIVEESKKAQKQG